MKIVQVIIAVLLLSGCLESAPIAHKTETAQASDSEFIQGLKQSNTQKK